MWPEKREGFRDDRDGQAARLRPSSLDTRPGVRPSSCTRETSLTSGAIAAQVGVSRRRSIAGYGTAGVALGRNADSHAETRPAADFSPLGDQIAEDFRQDVTVIMEQLEGPLGRPGRNACR